MHMAPCTKISSSVAVFSEISAISASDSSRASTTRSTFFCFSQKCTPAQLTTVAWVLMWIGTVRPLAMAMS